MTEPVGVITIHEPFPDWRFIAVALVVGVLAGAAFIHFFTETTDAGNH